MYFFKYIFVYKFAHLLICASLVKYGEYFYPILIFLARQADNVHFNLFSHFLRSTYSQCEIRVDVRSFLKSLKMWPNVFLAKIRADSTCSLARVRNSGNDLFIARALSLVRVTREWVK